tara:strand:- start:20 stop:157 length:138 start_codon:yes stop_codon:yes gene_type:complete
MICRPEMIETLLLRLLFLLTDKQIIVIACAVVLNLPATQFKNAIS